MNADELLQAVGETRADYLEHALLPPAAASRRAGSLGRRIALAAAVAALLAGTVYAAVSGLVTKEQAVGPQWYEVYLEENPAAADAPEEIVDHYLPARVPESYVLQHASVDVKDGKTLEAKAEWVRPDLQMVVKETEDTELEDGETWFTNAEVRYFYRPLKAVSGIGAYVLENAFSDLNGADMDRVIKSSEQIDGVDYLVYTCPADSMPLWSDENTWYFWMDENRRYLYSMFFSEPVPREDRLAFLRSVAPVDDAAWDRVMNPDTVTAFNGRLAVWNAAHPEAMPIAPIRLYLPSLRPEGYDMSQQWYNYWPNASLEDIPVEQWLDRLEELHGLECVGSDMLHFHLGIQLDDGSGRYLGCREQNFISGHISPDGDPYTPAELLDLLEEIGPDPAYKNSVMDRFTLDGKEILRMTWESSYEGRTSHYETWTFAAPDGSLLELRFGDGGAELPVSEELKIAFFRSIEEVDPAEQTPGYRVVGWG